MKIVRYLDERNVAHHCAMIDEGIFEALDGNIHSGLVRTGRTVVPKRIQSPVAPVAIIGVGLNYQRHAQESGARIPEYPVVFSKPVSALQHPGEPILIPTALPSHEVDYECELAVVIGRRCKNVRKGEALDYVLGYTCANDVSARDWQLKKGGGQWVRGKSFDTFCPLGPCLVTTDEIRDPNALFIRTRLNGRTVQDWTTKDMIFDVPTLIEFLSASTTLLPGTVILTGTPHGVGMAAQPPNWLNAGDSVVVEIEGIGQLANPVMLEP